MQVYYRSLKHQMKKTFQTINIFSHRFPSCKTKKTVIFLNSPVLPQGPAAIVGFAYSQIMVSTFARANSAAMRRGFRDDIKTYLLISGIAYIPLFPPKKFF